MVDRRLSVRGIRKERSKDVCPLFLGREDVKCVFQVVQKIKIGRIFK